MTDEDSHLYIIKKLEEHGDILKQMQRDLMATAVLVDRVEVLTTRVDALWNKHDAYFMPEGLISKIVAQQEDTKNIKRQVSALWVLTVPISIALISLSCILLKIAFSPSGI